MNMRQYQVRLLITKNQKILISRNASPDLRSDIESVLGVRIVDCHSKYLGLPLQMKQRRSDTFGAILDKMWAKTQSWKASNLSIGGRQVLIISVLNAIPQYWFSCFMLPDKV
ncbi:hypothetical protein QQ045_028379 [Rhodiola kirilowii]